ncbi:TonB-dependent receptor [Ravibacter arvi]|uniref:TonB-dependent receptor n=1 Tax=Ravibacter arvi TaxID=2051041 RepID=A0ABP8LPU2_9BACT
MEIKPISRHKAWYDLIMPPNLLMKMKLLTFFLLAALTQVWGTGYSQKISLEKRNVTLESALKAIESQTNYLFLYDRIEIPVHHRVSVNIRGESIEETLKQLFEGLPLTYKIFRHNIVIRKSQNSAAKKLQFQSKLELQRPGLAHMVTGKVTDERGEGLPGVSILVKGTQTGMISDVDGSFSIEVPGPGAILVFSFVGYLGQELAVGERTHIEISLRVDTKSLEEVVVVGYGGTQKVNLTGAISTIQYDDKLNNRPVTNASQALGGTASGVWVSQNSGKPGSDGAQIRIRGWGTLNNSNPLIIVDGVEGSFDQLNPSDIQSISVLKDAASAAIYGSKAANGVVLITTKMAADSDKMQVNVNSYVGIQSLGRHFSLINNSAQSMELTNAAMANNGSSPIFPQQLIDSYKSGGDAFKYPNTDWFRELFGNALIQQNNLSISGASGRTSTYLSLNNLNQQGLVPNTNSRRLGIRANVDTRVNSWFKLAGRLSFLNRLSKEPYADVHYGSLGRVFEMLGGATPYTAAYDRKGRFGSVEAFDEAGAMLYDNRNPLIDAANGRTTTQDNLMMINTTADFNITEDLLFKTTFSSNGAWSLVDRYNTSVFGYTDSGIETTTRNYNREGLEMNRGADYSMNTNFFSTLTWSKAFNGHDFKLLAGFQNESNKIQNVFARRNNPPKEGLTQVDAGTAGIQGTGNMNRLRILSYFGRVNYALKDKYLFEANFRADGSSRFRKGSRWGYFPGVSLGWRVSEEAFLRHSDLVSNLKLRASWGKLGNQNVASYAPYLTIIDQSNLLSNSFGGAFAPGMAITSLVDENISWEQTSTLDIGVEAGFWNNRVSVEADYFRKNTTDILVQLPIPLVLGGLTAPFENKGAMQNDGVEVILNYRNISPGADRLKVDVGFNLTYIKNKVTDFGTERSPDQLFLIREGYSFRELYGYKTEGIYQSDAEAKEHMYANGFVPRAGNLKFRDVNNDGRMDYQDKQSLGNTIPKFTYGISPSFKYKGFDLNILLQGVSGVNLFNRNIFTNLAFENRVIQTRWLDAWTPENSGSELPMARFDDSWNSADSDFWVVNGSFMKVKNLQLGYGLPGKITERLKVQKAYLYLNAQNLWTIASKEYDGYDPERNTFDAGAAIYPVPRILSFGVNLNF